jgi:hypothetical protein
LMLMMMMMEKKTDQCSHVSYIYHACESLFDDFELQTVSKRRVNVEPLLPSLLVVHAQEAHARAGVSHA